MAVNTDDELLIVNENIDRYHAYRAAKLVKKATAENEEVPEGALQRICQGVYMRYGANEEAIFEEFGLRIARYLMPQASISYATAWFGRPTLGRVFVTGQYQYTKQLFGDSDRYMIVQSIGEIDPENAKLHTLQTFRDSLGEFTMLCDTPEMTLLNMMTSTKRHAEKHLNEPEQDKLIEHLISKHGSKPDAINALEQVAAMAKRENEFRRLVTLLYAPRPKQKPNG